MGDPSNRRLMNRTLSPPKRSGKISPPNFSEAAKPSGREGVLSNDRAAQTERLQTHLAISPKTASLLHAAGYSNPRSFRGATPKEVALRLCALPGMDAASAQAYMIDARRMLMLADIDTTEEATATATRWPDFSDEELVRLGIWEDGFDDMTGEQIRRKVGSVTVRD